MSVVRARNGMACPVRLRRCVSCVVSPPKIPSLRHCTQQQVSVPCSFVQLVPNVSQIDNIESFRWACRKLGVEDHDIISVEDVYEMKSIRAVVKCLVGSWQTNGAAWVECRLRHTNRWRQLHQSILGLTITSNMAMEVQAADGGYVILLVPRTSK